MVRNGQNNLSYREVPRLDGGTSTSLIIINGNQQASHCCSENQQVSGADVWDCLTVRHMFDHGLNTIGRIAHAVAPTLDKCAGITAAHHTKQLTDDYQMLRAKVMGVHYEWQSVGNHLRGNLRRQVPELGI